MRHLVLLGLSLVLCSGCHTPNRGGPLGFGLLGSNNNGVASAPPVYATPPQYVQVQQPAPVAVAAAPVVAAPQYVTAAPVQQQPIIVQQAPVVASPQVVQPAAYYHSDPCAPVCCQPCQ